MKARSLDFFFLLHQTNNIWSSQKTSTQKKFEKNKSWKTQLWKIINFSEKTWKN